MADDKNRPGHDAITELRPGPAGSSEPRTISDPDADFVLLPPGERYELRTTLGEGGMGEVRLCRDRVIGRDVAMKVVLASVEDRREMRARFVREARVQGQLEHPSIVPVYDFGIDAAGAAFFTMKRVRGVTLERVLDALRRGDAATEKAYTRHKLLAAFVQACLAVDYAHEHGVLHRDLKPSNVMLGGYGEVYVVDWGLAKIRGAARTLDPSVPRAEPSAPHIGDADATIPTTGDTPATIAGAVLGTPGYMAPEQIRGEEIDVRSDVYALGSILFELLVLEPLHGPGPVASIMKRSLQGFAQRPSLRVPSRDVAPELDAICATACALDRATRFRSARELADAVEAYLSGDRDLAMRRDLSKVHLARAHEAAARALVPDASSDERRDALREVGRAIVLHPEDLEAHALFVRILSEPPRDPPREVVEALERSARLSQRRILPRAAAAFGLSMIIFLPLQVAAGIRSVALALLPMILWMLAGFVTWLAYRFDDTSRRTFPYVTIVAAAAVAATSVLHGPLLVVPAIAGVISMGMALQTHPQNRLFSTVANLVAILVPTALAWAGLHPVKHAFVDGTMVIYPGALELPRGATFAILGGVHALVVVLASFFAGSYRDALTRLETRSQLVAWQLRQLVPPEAATEMDRLDRRLPDKD